MVPIPLSPITLELPATGEAMTYTSLDNMGPYQSVVSITVDPKSFSNWLRGPSVVDGYLVFPRLRCTYHYEYQYFDAYRMGYMGMRVE